jgi:hypothetical protein
MSEYLRLMDWKMFDIMKLRNCFSVSSRDKRYFSPQESPDQLWDPLSHLFSWYLGGGRGKVLQKFSGGSMKLIFNHHLLPRLSMNKVYLSSLICLQGVPVTTLLLHFNPPFVFHIWKSVNILYAYYTLGYVLYPVCYMTLSKHGICCGEMFGKQNLSTWWNELSFLDSWSIHTIPLTDHIRLNMYIQDMISKWGSLACNCYINEAFFFFFKEVLAVTSNRPWSLVQQNF